MDEWMDAHKEGCYYLTWVLFDFFFILLLFFYSTWTFYVFLFYKQRKESLKYKNKIKAFLKALKRRGSLENTHSSTQCTHAYTHTHLHVAIMSRGDQIKWSHDKIVYWHLKTILFRFSKKQNNKIPKHFKKIPIQDKGENGNGLVWRKMAMHLKRS